MRTLGLYALLSCSGIIAAIDVQAQSATATVGLVAAPDQRFQRGTTTLRYHERGAGDPVILIHGYASDLSAWAGVGDSLVRDHRVLAVDLRGFGQSTKSKDPAEFGLKLADDVLAFANSLKLERFHVVGHSMGALVAANLAARYPDRIASASLIAGPFYADSAALTQFMARFGADLKAGRGLTGLLHWLFATLDSATVQQMSDGAMTQNDVGSLIRQQGEAAVTAGRRTTSFFPLSGDDFGYSPYNEM
jgi:pimeloyl-ACP methyl ester carboxylesterase